jgi:hypothetical protein
MQTIAILTTKARVLHGLKYRNKAEELIAEAITRIKIGSYHAKHPYALEAKRRHSIFLDDGNKIPPAEKLCIEVALSRVEVLGPNTPSQKRARKMSSVSCALLAERTSLANSLLN